MFEKKKDKNKIIILIDFENLIHKIEKVPSLEKFSVSEGFDRLIEQISQEVGEIINVFVFAPPHIIATHGEEFPKLGFFIIYCPKVRNKVTQNEEDTVDATLMEFGKKLINQIPPSEFTHLCIGSGDKDFTPLIREARQRKRKIIIIASNLNSLSAEMIKLVDKKTDSSKMVYLFSPSKNEATE